jgi:murein L,D-transpeptidase YcbB/YkuD
MKVVVGKAEMKTPLIAGTVRTATLNPYWNVPADLVRRSIAPAAAAGGAAFLRAKGYELWSGWGADARPLSSDEVDWRAVADGRADVRVRQKPGPGNMMGAVKFEFAPAQGIYLHDTPDRSLFAREVRTFSSGCIRLEHAARVGRWLMGHELVAKGEAAEQVVALPRPVPVYVTYLTARVEDGRLALAPDVYGLDGSGEARLASR